MKRFTEITPGVNWYRDNETGLEWSETAPHRMDHAAALEWCESVGGRLPTVKELLALTDYNAKYPCTSLPGTISDAYWSASTYALFTSKAWYVDFSVGEVCALYKKVNGLSVRAVRS